MANGSTGSAAAKQEGLFSRLWRGLMIFISREYRRTIMSSLKGVPALMVVIALGLTAFGLVMVLSASSVEQIASGESPFAQVQRQLVFALVGIVLMLVLAFTPVSWYRNKWVMHSLLALALLGQLLVVTIGTTVNGNRNWIQISGLSIQPSELSKLLLALWMAWVLTQQGNVTRASRKALFPLLFGFLPLVGLILLGHDVGTVLVYGLMLLGALWLAGMNYKAFIMGLVFFAAAGAIAVLSSPNRMARVLGIFGRCEGATCDQSNSGMAALATGGFWGVGLGRSRQKYNYLPEAHNDYIFAVIGEELGLLGTLLIIFLYFGLIYCVVRIVLRSADRFISLAAGTILVWISGQAIINIAMVSGVLPVIGIPLPFISYGGSSLVSSLAAIGLLIAFARQTPLQPIMQDGETEYYVGTDAKESARRVKLGHLVAAEASRLEAAGDQAGWDIKRVGEYFGFGSSRPLSASVRGVRPVRGTKPTPGPASRQRPSSGAAPRPGKRTAAPSPPRRTAAGSAPDPRGQRRGGQDGRPAQKPRGYNPAKVRKVSGPRTQTPAQEQRDRLPAGLAPIRQIRSAKKKGKD
ncbi:MAG: putative lipid II flippase FtsW [Rothia sp. (in: high G+C Gram-positive bacteria)]|nr:putative lipid II flippase FtsW [Rothia sp. (in: high G+C Gram-positive bacteria)]